jgi:hypothetical protein
MNSNNALTKLQAAVAVSVVRVDKADTERIISDGFNDFSNTMAFAYENLSSTDMLEAKYGGNIFEKPLSLYEKISACTTEMLLAIETKKNDRLEYALITGNDLDSVCSHKADRSFKVRRALINGAYITEPHIKAAQEKRNMLVCKCDAMEAQLCRTMSAINLLPEAERVKLASIVEEANTDFDLLNAETTESEIALTELFKEAQLYEREYGFTLDATTGKKIFPKESTYNDWYSSIVKVGRTALTEFKKYESMYGLDSVIPLPEIKKASKVLGLSK